MMNNKELIKLISDQSGVSSTVTQNVLNALVDVITDKVSNWHDVRIYKLGTFKAWIRKARNWVNPRTWEKIIIPEMKSLSFKASNTIKNVLKK